jgi:hypothetical protein
MYRQIALRGVISSVTSPDLSVGITTTPWHQKERFSVRIVDLCPVWILQYLWSVSVCDESRLL